VHDSSASRLSQRRYIAQVVAEDADAARYFASRAILSFNTMGGQCLQTNWRLPKRLDSLAGEKIEHAAPVMLFVSRHRVARAHPATNGE
jgi:hypothetical protein